MPTVPAYILAGGASRRFGSDKARALVEGQPLILRIAKVARAMGLDTTVVADHPEKYADLGLRTIADLVPGQGPLGGLQALWADATGADWALVMACDLEPVHAAWIVHLLAGRGEQVDAVLLASRPRQPLLACYRRTTLPAVSRLLGGGNGSMSALLDACRVVYVPGPTGPVTLHNINRPGDLAGAVREPAGEKP